MCVLSAQDLSHPPQNTDQQFKNSNFIDQFTDQLTEELPNHQDLIIMGDINIHINNSEDQDAQTNKHNSSFQLKTTCQCPNT